MGMEGTKRLLGIWSSMSSLLSVVISRRRVPRPSICKPLPMPFRTVSEEGVRSMKSDCRLEIQLEAPVSMHRGQPPGVKFISFV